jgi:hypothetical protein
LQRIASVSGTPSGSLISVVACSMPTQAEHGDDAVHGPCCAVLCCAMLCDARNGIKGPGGRARRAATARHARRPRCRAMPAMHVTGDRHHPGMC